MMLARQLIIGISMGVLCGCMALNKPKPLEDPIRERPAPEQASILQENIKKLLDDAEIALSVDRLTSPIHDNAFDRFQAVLMLQPEHPQALSGLQQVLLRYLELARKAIARQEYGKAKALLERARWVDKSNDRIESLANEIQRAVKTKKGSESVASGNEFELATRLLDSHDVAVIEQLESIARQTKETGASLLIVARSDAEGRWIYKQMKQAVPGFLLRGDITLGKSPKILMLPAID